MKKLFSVFLFSLLMGGAFSQDFTTLMKLHDYAVTLGSTTETSFDTVLMKARVGKMHIRLAEQLVYLLRAAEFYSAGDYENSGYFIHKVNISATYPEYYNLKLLLYIGNYCQLKDLESAARYFYIVNRSDFMDPQNMKSIRKVISRNFNKAEFSDAISEYFYYHKRLDLIAEINFPE